MATVQSQMNGFEPVLDDLPAWKKDLILRRRANAKFHGEATIQCGGKGTPHSPTTVPLEHILPCSVQGQSQLSVRSVQGPVSSLRSVRVHKSTNSVQLATQTSEERKCRKSSEVSCDKNYDISLVEKCTLDSDIDMRGPSVMHHKGVSSPRGTSKEGWCNNEEEEFEYGPGIVSRLKNRYLSLALREAKGRASLRKYSSLEDLLDDGGNERGRSSQKDRPLSGGAGHKESMKRARSMDSLSFRRNDNNDKVPRSHSSGALRHALETKDIIIIENPRPKATISEIPTCKGVEIPPPQLKKQSSLLEEEELPPPDTVKQVKQIFESSGRASRGTIATKVASYKATHSRKYTVSQKPPIKAKPTQLHTKNISPIIENAKASLRQVQPIIRSSPRSVLNVKPVAPLAGSGPTSPLASITSGLTPISASVTSPQINGEKMSLIINEGHSKKSDSPTMFPRQEEVRPRPHSPPPSLLPLSPTPTHRSHILSTSKSEIIASHEKERVLHENKKNREKSLKERHLECKTSAGSPTHSDDNHTPNMTPETNRLEENVSIQGEQETTKILEKNISTPPVEVTETKQSLSSSVLEVIRAAEAKTSSSTIVSPSGLKANKGKDGRRSAQESSPLVFNFSKRTDTPDYIENDGVDLSKRPSLHEPGYVIMPGYDGKNDSSTDGDDDGVEDSLDAIRMGVPPPPCNIIFEGEGVIINGRSNLQRQPRTRKLEVSFDMPSTSTFEYPSENYLIQELDARGELPGSSEINSSTSAPSLSTGGLATYTPSKLKLSDSFELGVSRSSVPQPPTPPKSKEPLENELLLLQDHLRPADENETVTWSAESAPDMLF